jgi:hypothetical protein
MSYRVLLPGQASHGSQAMQRRRFKYLLSFVDRLVAKRLREEAENLPPGEERDTLLKMARSKARQPDGASYSNKWLMSSELQPPE